MENMNQELQTAHKFLKKQYEIFLKSNKIKTEEERIRWGHAIQTIGNIAYNHEIRDR